MQLIIGGAYAGKRKVARERFDGNRLSWLCSYEGDSLWNWHSFWLEDSVLVLEGFENWLMDEIRAAADDRGSAADRIRSSFNEFFHTLMLEEEHRGQSVCLIMLEMGRGIVPVEEEDRLLRDLNGWIQQDAATLSDDVYYVWHGLAKKLK